MWLKSLIEYSKLGDIFILSLGTTKSFYLYNTKIKVWWTILQFTSRNKYHKFYPSLIDFSRSNAQILGAISRIQKHESYAVIVHSWKMISQYLYKNKLLGTIFFLISFCPLFKSIYSFNSELSKKTECMYTVCIQIL